ncbi:AT-rich interactive domain-containing protein 2 isoform X2 [Nicotiana tabacum]|uniref:AT-rich interactive domain-containing protein 2 isoform X2 n=2 Tax=Nicotiana tabacum TaxID=4097 RepID=A0A1S4BNC9_TOBAC|nr:PREDICTED: AT-rich interactive domain-containing protein 2-like isoform X2 [Nicotiana tabacum]
MTAVSRPACVHLDYSTGYLLSPTSPTQAVLVNPRNYTIFSELMEAWSSLNDESQVYKGNESGSGINLTVEVNGIDGCSKNRLKSLFDQVLSVFLSEVTEKKCVRPLPVMTGSGQPLDLFKLYWIVRKIGGYDRVSSKNLWGFIAEHCGLDVGAVAFVKLVYVKYLAEFDHWLRQFCKDGNLEKGEGGVIRRLDLLSKELETRFRRLLLRRCQKKKDTNLLPSKNGQVDFEMFTAENVNKTNGHTTRRSYGAENRNGNLYNRDEISISKMDDDYVFLVSAEGIVEKVLYKAPDKSNNEYDDDENFFARDGKNKVTSNGEVIQRAASAKSVIENVFDSRKRKRESSCFSGMLNWINHAAKHSNDPEIGEVPESSKWKGHTSNEFWFQVLLVKEALLKRRHIDTNAEESNPQKKLRMHPSMYEEERLNNQPAEKLRCSKRIPVSPKHAPCPCCNSCSTSHNKAATHQKEEEEDIRPDLTSVEVSVTEKIDDSGDQQTHPEVSVGPLHQAEVPEWSGVISESDSKWLGTRMWPPEVETTKSLVELDPIGEGRRSSCGCRFPQSVECIRFHIAEKRFKLKLELGPLFNRWRFDRMGEEVSLSWTSEEEERFKDMVRSSATSNNKWKNSKKLLPSKTREKLVSYYFNVFLIRRRSYQNRVTPKELDSDDDEIELGSVGDSFGNIAVHVPSSRSLTCVENKVCTDLE